MHFKFLISVAYKPLHFDCHLKKTWIWTGHQPMKAMIKLNLPGLREKPSNLMQIDSLRSGGLRSEVRKGQTELRTRCSPKAL
jgi:hypothetical protein